MFITPEVLFIQFIIAVIVYFLAREYRIHLGKILTLGSILTIIWPFAAIEPSEVTFELFNSSLQSYSAVFANQIVGIFAGFIIPFVGNHIWQGR